MALLAGLKVVQLGDGLAAAICGRLFGDVGARVTCIDPGSWSPLAHHLNHGKTVLAGETPAARPPTVSRALLPGPPQNLSLNVRAACPDPSARLPLFHRALSKPGGVDDPRP